jgi:hypothetical protein
VLSDGSAANETLTEYTDNHSFACEVTNFTSILERLVEDIRGEWTFTPDGKGTVWACRLPCGHGGFLACSHIPQRGEIKLV